VSAARAALAAGILLLAALAVPPAAAQERRVELVFAPELLSRIATDNQGEQSEGITERILGLSRGIAAVEISRSSGRITLTVTPREQDGLRPTFRFTVDKMLYYRMNTARGDITGMTEMLQEAKKYEPLLGAIAYRADDRYAIVEFTLDLRAAYEARERAQEAARERARDEAEARAAVAAEAAAARASAREEAGRQKAEEERAERQRVEREQAARERAEREQAERDRARREREEAARAAAAAKAEAEKPPPPPDHLGARRLGRGPQPAVDGAAGDAAWAEAPRFPVEVQGASGRFTVTSAAVWNAERIWFLLRWPDRDRSDRHRPWTWSSEEKAYVAGREIEDAVALGFPREGRLGDCMLSGTEAAIDLWTWRAGRTDPAGYAEDGTLTLSFSRITRANSYQTRSGRTVWIKETADAGTLPYQSQVAGAFAGERIPRYVARTPSGSAADVTAKGVWKDGFWTVEFSRRLATGDPGDVVFAPGRDLWFSVAVFDHREGDDHSSSKELRLRLEER